MDVVSYSLLPMDHQSEVISELQEIVRGISDFQQALGREELICLPTGDGMALAFFGDPNVPFRCARDIAVELKKNSRFSLRMGLHTGPVYRVADINANRNLAGGGINFAQRVMDCGDAGHILVSKAAAEILLQLSNWSGAIHDIGEMEVKHGVRVNVFNVFTEEFGNPCTPLKMNVSEKWNGKTPAPKLSDRRADADGQNERCPFRGLQAFRTEDSDFFAGRELVCTRLWEALQIRTFIAIVGASGSGKSSLVQAGLLARIEQHRPGDGEWLHASFIPGRRPFERLASAILSLTNPELKGVPLAREGQCLVDGLQTGSTSLEFIFSFVGGTLGNSKILLIIDQFEELFTMTEGAERRRFINMIFRACSDQVHIVITLRADYYGHAIAVDRALSDSLEVASVNIGPMTREEAAEAIKLPAQAVGADFEPGLVSRILDDVEEQPGYLPLLEFALTELWERRHGKLFTHGAYEDIGGIAGAIANRGENLFVALSDPERVSVRRLFSRLVRVAKTGDEGTDTRARVRRGELSNVSWSLVERFAAQEFRLLVISRDADLCQETVEIAHEALISNWDRLAKWIEEDRQFLLWRQEIAVFLAAWESSHRDAASHLRATRLRDSLRWLIKRKDDLNREEIEFIQSSRSAARVRKVLKRSKWAGVGFVTLLVVGLVSLGRTDWSIGLNIANDRNFAQFIRERGSPAFPADRYCAALVYSGQTPAAGCPINAVVSAFTAIGQEQVARQYIAKLSDGYFRCDALLAIGFVFEKNRDVASAQRTFSDALAEVRQISNLSSKAWALNRVADAFGGLSLTDVANRLIVEAKNTAFLSQDPRLTRDTALLRVLEITDTFLSLHPKDAVQSIATDETDDETRCRRLLGLAERLAHTNQAAAAVFIKEAISRTDAIPQKIRVQLLSRATAAAVESLPNAQVVDISESVLGIAKALPYGDDRDDLLGALLYSFWMAANNHKAQQVQDMMNPDYGKQIQFTLFAINRLVDLNQQQNAERLLRALDKRVHDILRKRVLSVRSAGVACMAVNALAALHARNGNSENANRLLAEGGTCVETVNTEDWRSRIFELRAIARAFLGDFMGAVASSAYCSNSEHKLSAHAMILAELGKRKHAPVLKWVNMVEENWPGLYWLSL